MSDDTTAIQQCRAGETDSFRPLVERYQAEAIGHALVILGNRDDALDAVQDAFLDAFRALDQFDTSRPFYPWLYVILRNRCFKLLEQRKKHDAAQPLEESQCVLLQTTDANADAQRIQHALLELSPDDREIVTLRHLDGLTYAELAERLDIPIGTVMSRLYNARRRLRDKLQ